MANPHGKNQNELQLRYEQYIQQFIQTLIFSLQVRINGFIKTNVCILLNKAPIPNNHDKWTIYCNFTQSYVILGIGLFCCCRLPFQIHNLLEDMNLAT